MPKRMTRHSYDRFLPNELIALPDRGGSEGRRRATTDEIIFVLAAGHLDPIVAGASLALNVPSPTLEG